jgi:surface polysaccharide O-acyltransferase-like enzyme
VNAQVTVPAPRRRVLAYDALRTFAILSVVGIHSLMALRGLIPEHGARMVTDEVLHYAVPLFVFMSGALVWGRPWKPHPGAYRRFLLGRARSILLPYLAWSVVYLGIGLSLAEKPARLLARSPALLLSGNAWFHLYFVPMLLGFYLLTPWASRLAHKWPEAFVVVAYVVRILLWPLVASALKDLDWQAWSYATHFMTHLPHMAFGAWFAVRRPYERPLAQRWWPLLLAAGLSGLVAIALDAVPNVPVIGAWIEPVTMAAVVLGFAFAAFATEPLYDRRQRLVLDGALLSFGVYFVHPALLKAIRLTLEATGTQSLWLIWWMPVAVWVVLCAGSYAVSWSLARVAATSWVVGLRSGAGG